MTARIVACTAALALCLTSCRGKSGQPVQLTAGPTAEDRVEFVPHSSFAEYFALDDLRNELRITLTSYPASCEEFAAPSGDNVSIVVNVVTPPGRAPAPGVYPWAGHAAHGGTPTRPERPFAAPTARIGTRGFALPPGGSVELKSLTLELDGRVSGYLAFEFPGDAEQPATSLRGHFDAKLCRLSVP